MAINYTFHKHGLSKFTKQLLLQRIAKQRNKASILRGTIEYLEVQPNGSVKVTGYHKDETSRQLELFTAIYIPEDFSTTVLKDRVLKIQTPPGERRIVWNIEVCEIVRKEFGLLLQSDDFIPVKINPNNESITLTFLPYHPFYKGSITVMVNDSITETVLSKPNEVISLKPIDCSRIKSVFSLTSVGDLLTTQQSQAIMITLGHNSGWNLVPARTELNLFMAKIISASENGLVLELNPKYQTEQYGLLSLLF